MYAGHANVIELHNIVSVCSSRKSRFLCDRNVAGTASRYHYRSVSGRLRNIPYNSQPGRFIICKLRAALHNSGQHFCFFSVNSCDKDRSRSILYHVFHDTGQLLYCFAFAEYDLCRALSNRSVCVHLSVAQILKRFNLQLHQRLFCSDLTAFNGF